MVDCAIVVWRLVPYHDARFSAAAERADIAVIEVSGHDGGKAWSDDVTRRFPVVSLGDERDPARETLPVDRVAETLDRIGPRIVAIQGWSDPAAYTTAAWALRNNAPIIMFSESNRYDHRRSGWSEWLKSRILGVCDAALVGGRHHADYLVDLGFERSRISLGYNAVDNDHFAAPPPTSGSAPCPYFLVVSRLVENKNIELVIRSYAAYRASCSADPWGLVVLGAGPLEEHLRATIADLGIDAHARLEGFRKYHDLPALYQCAGAFVQASTWEPWGLAVNEAMAAGLPVIVADRVGCAVELVEDGVNGFTFAAGDGAALTRHMRALANGAVDRRAFGGNSRRIVAAWGPARFASGLAEAIDVTRRAPAPRKALDRLIVEALARWQGRLAPGVLLSRRAAAQNRTAQAG